MLLRGKNGVEFELSIIDYEFPKLSKSQVNTCDANWLMMDIKAKTADVSWQVAVPALKIRDITRITTWFSAIKRAMIKGRTLGSRARILDFLEPYLNFYVVEIYSKEVVLRICFNYEVRPPVVSDDQDDDYWIDIHLDDNDLAAAAESLSAELKRFRRRKRRKNR